MSGSAWGSLTWMMPGSSPGTANEIQTNSGAMTPGRNRHVSVSKTRKVMAHDDASVPDDPAPARFSTISGAYRSRHVSLKELPATASELAEQGQYVVPCDRQH